MKTICFVCMIPSNFSGHPIFYICFGLWLLLLRTLGHGHGSHHIHNSLACDIAAIANRSLIGHTLGLWNIHIFNAFQSNQYCKELNTALIYEKNLPFSLLFHIHIRMMVYFLWKAQEYFMTRNLPQKKESSSCKMQKRRWTSSATAMGLFIVMEFAVYRITILIW